MSVEISPERVNVNGAWRAHVGMAWVQLSYSIFHVISKLALDDGVNQLVLCFYRDLLALLILAPAAYFCEKGIRPPLNAKFLMTFFFLGLTGIFGNQLLILLGLAYTSPAYTAAVQPAIPVFTFVVALLTGAEVVNLRKFEGQTKLVGTLVCISGAVLMVVFQGPAVFSGPSVFGLETSDIDRFSMFTRGQADPSALSISNFLDFRIDDWNLGVLCLIGNCMCMAVYFAVQAPLLDKYPAIISVTAYSYAFGTLLMIVTTVLGANKSTDWNLKQADVLTILYSGIIACASSWAITTWSNKILGPALISLYYPLQPVASAVLSKIFLGSTIYLGSILGGLFVVAGLYIVTWATYIGKKAKFVVPHTTGASEPLINHDSFI